MSADAWLTPEEVETLTDRKRWRAQCRQLAALGIPFRPNAVGRPLVERAAVFTGKPAGKAPAKPDWSALRGPPKAA